MKLNHKILAAAVVALGSVFAASTMAATAAPLAPAHQNELHKKPQAAHKSAKKQTQPKKHKKTVSSKAKAASHAKANKPGEAHKKIVH